jgi:hypothetical protein
MNNVPRNPAARAKKSKKELVGLNVYFGYCPEDTGQRVVPDPKLRKLIGRDFDLDNPGLAKFCGGRSMA